MASGTIHIFYHNKFWIPTILISLLVNFAFFRNNLIQAILFEGFFLVFYLIGENLVSPDLDLISVSGQDGRLITFGKHVADKLKKLGFIGKIIGFFVGILPFMFSQWSAFYSYTMEFVGGHRNFFSHSPLISTIGRMIWFNIIIVGCLSLYYSYGVAHWGWGNNYIWEMYIDVWALPFLIGQFLSWGISDIIHLILDSNYAKGRLY